MTMEDILNEWEKDGALDLSELARESSDTYLLHAKYQRMYVAANRKLREMMMQVEEFRRDLTIFYRDGGDPESIAEAKQRGWLLPPQGKPLKADVETYVNTCPGMVTLNLALAEQSDMVTLLHEIIESINTRSYMIGHAIADAKFKAGIGG
jgi:hypothetical protein